MTSRTSPGSSSPPPGLGAYRPSEERPGASRLHPQAHDAYGAAPPPLPPQSQAPYHQPPGPQHPPYGQPPGRPPGRPGPPPGGRRPAGGGPPPPRPPGGYRPGPPERPGGGVLKIVTIAALVVVTLAAAGAAALYVAGPSDLVRSQIIARVKAQTGRDLVIKGPTSFALFPSLGVAMQDVSLSAPPGMTAPPLVTMKNLTVSVGLMPLLKRDLKVERLVLSDPVFSLQIDAAGRKSWDFAAAAPETRPPIRLAQAPATADGPLSDAPPPGSSGPAPSATRDRGLNEVALSDVRIERGTVLWVDQRTGAMQTVSGIDLRVAAPAITATTTASGKLRWRAETFDVAVELTSLHAVLRNAPARIVADVSGRPLAARYEGSFALGGALDAEGDLVLESASLRSLAAFAAGAATDAAATDPFRIAGKLRAANNTYTLSGATGSLDRTKGSGDIAVTTGGARPILKANLKFAELDLNAILENGRDGRGGAAAAPAAAKSPAAAPAASDPGPNAPRSIEDLLEADPGPAPGPQVRGFTQRRGWSEDRYDFSAFGLLDADARLAVGRLLYKDIKVGQSQIAVALTGRVLKAEFADVQLYGGRGKGLIAIDATDPALPRIVTNLMLDGVEGRALLKDAADLDWLTGRGKIVLGVTGQGTTQRALMSSLGGSADLSFTDGAIIGLNIPGLLRNVGQGKLGGLDSAPTEKTDFSQLTSSWAINNGVARNSDLQLVGPLIRVTGSGAVKLGERALDYTLKPKITADPAAPAGNISIGSIEVPVRVSGPWEKPKFAPDMKGILKDPDKAVDAIKQIGKQFKGKDANEILKGLFGGGAAKP